MAKLIAQLVTWNGVKYIPRLFRSLREQTLQEWDFIIIDNGSTDETVAAIERELKELSQFRTKLRKEFWFQFVRNDKNRGFAGGHNQGFETQNAKRKTQNDCVEFVQLLNQDTVLAPDYLEQLVKFMERTPKCGAAQGTLLRWDFFRAGDSDGGRTDTIDTLGLRVLRSRRVVELGTGERLSVTLAHPHSLPLPEGRGEKEGVEVFGVSGALPMYRRAALLDVALQGSESEIFDEDFFSYKEDVDIAFRLRSRGWRAFVVLEARAWHDRTAAGPRELSDAAALDQRRSKSALVRYHSYKNHLLVLLKNEHAANFARDWPWVCWYELKKFAYVVFFERATLRALREAWRRLPDIRAKRAYIMSHATVTPAALRRWFV